MARTGGPRRRSGAGAGARGRGGGRRRGEVRRTDGGPGDEGAAGVYGIRCHVIVEQQGVVPHDLQIHGGAEA
jgi:hypothetical protein